MTMVTAASTTESQPATAGAPQPPRQPPHARAWNRRARLALLHTLLLVLAAVLMTPLVFGVLASLSPLDQVLSTGSQLLPEEWRWSTYANAWTRANFSTYFFNSLLVTAGVVVLDTVASSMTGYVLARRAMRGQRLLEAVYIGTLFIGLTTAMLYPQYRIAESLGIANLLGMTLVELAGVMVVHIFLIKAFVSGLGTELEDAARVDGCGFFGTYWRIALPLMRPILATTIILGFQASWNNYQVPLTFSLSEPGMRTLVVGVSALQYDAVDGIAAYNTVLAGANLALLPIVIAFILLQRYFIRGWTEGATKG